MTLSKLIDRVDKSIDRGDLPRAFRTKLDSLREQTEATEAGFQELNARIKGLKLELNLESKSVKLKSKGVNACADPLRRATRVRGSGDH